MNDTKTPSAPVSGTCEHCGCALGYVATQQDDQWYCCGACAGSDCCSCGCKPEHEREAGCDAYVPTRRMFAARHPDGLRRKPEDKGHLRAFPFADPRRGR